MRPQDPMYDNASGGLPEGGAIEVHRPAARPAGGWLVTAPDGLPDEAAGAPQQRPATPIRAALRFKWTMVLVFLLVAVPAVAAIWALVKPQYRARAEIRVRPIIPRLVFKTDENGAIPLYTSYMNTQIAILRSPTVLRRVLEQADIRQTRWFADPPRPLLGGPTPSIERLNEALVVRPRPQTEIIDVLFTAGRPKDAETVVDAVLDQYMAYNRYMLDETEDQLWKQLQGEYNSLEAEIGGGENVVALLRKELGTGDPDDLVARKRLRVDETEAELKTIQQRLALLEVQKRYLQRGRRVDEASTRERERLRFVRYVASLPVASRAELDRRLAVERKTLADRAANCAGQLEAAASQPAVTVTADDPPAAPATDERDGWTADVATARLEVLRDQIEMIDWQREELAALLDEPSDAPATSAAPPGAPSFQEDGQWRQLDQAVKDAQDACDLAAISFKPGHPRMQALAGALESAIDRRRERERYLAERHAESMALSDDAAADDVADDPLPGEEVRPAMNYRSRLMAIDAELALLAHQRQLVADELNRQREDFERTFASARTLAKEERALAHKRQLFRAVRERLDHKAMERDVPGSIEVLNRAFAPTSPVSDRRLVFTAMVLVLAVGVGFVTAWFRAYRVEEVLAADDLPVQLRAPFLGDLPMMSPTTHTSELTTALMAERVRMVRTALLNRLTVGPDLPASTLLITSASSGAGKSTVSALLGRSFAECGKRVLLVDADLRRAGLSEQMDLADRDGLADSLSGNLSPRQAVCDTDTPNLHVVPAGRRRGDSQLEMMANGVLEGLLADWQRDFDVILFDSPPILPVADARILAGRVDGTVMVIRQDSCLRTDVVEALACLGSSGGKLLGTIFIGDRRRDGYGYSRRSNYYDYTYTTPEVE